MSIAKKVADLLPSNQSDSVDGDDVSETERSSSTLYECTPCNTTYISSAMDECPTCGGDVGEVPSEKELGMI